MSEFGLAYIKTMRDEGGYANSSSDRGGETWKGIARAFHPNWIGWGIVDDVKAKTGMRSTIDNLRAWRSVGAALEDIDQIERMVQEFYRKEFWNAIHGDEIESQAIANELFDIAVNMHPSRAKMFLQTALNLLNSDQKFWPDLVLDGNLGPKTFGALRACAARGDLPLLLKVINVQQGCHYLDQLKRPSQEGFARAWFSRVTI